MIGVVVVSYHSPERTVHFVSQELAKLPWEHRVCVVDVAATSATEQYLAEHLPADTIRLECPENLGYSRGNNRGAERLRRECPDLEFLLICNDDVELIEPQSLKAMVEALEENSCRGIVGPDCIGPDSLHQSPWDSADDLGRRESWRRRPVPFGGVSRQCYAVRGCFLMVRAEPFFQVGGFDEEFFLFFEEPVLGERFARIGLTTWYESSAKVRHLGSATIRRSLSAGRIYRLYRRSFFLMARKYWGWNALQRLCWPVTHLLARLSRIVFVACR